MKKTLIIGSAHADLIAKVKELPKGNEDLNAEVTELRISGSGYRNAYIFQKIGFEYDLIAPNGKGTYGEFTKEEALKNGVELNCESEEMSGCTYHMIDAKGNQSFFCVPGTEYDFSIDYLQDLDADEIEHVILWGDLLQGEGTEEVIGTLQELDQPVYFAPGPASDTLEEELREELYALKPVLHLTDTEAFYLAKERRMELASAAKYLHECTEAPVLILKNGEGCYYCDQDEFFLAPEEKKMDAELHLCMYTLCRISGVDVRNALMFANRFAAEYNDRTPTEWDMEYEKRKLTDLILMK